MSDACACGWVPDGDVFSVAELGKLPGRLCAELVDGLLVVTPRATVAQQTVVQEVGFLLRRSSPARFHVLLGPVEYQLGERVLLQPDVLVCNGGRLPRGPVKGPLQLVVEVVSDSTRTVDLVLKKALYEQAGVPAYWMFDAGTQVLTVLELAEGKYVERCTVTGNEAFEATVPFSVKVVPAELVRRVSG